MRRMPIAFFVIAVFSGISACGEDYVEVSFHINLPVPAEIDAFCLGVSAAERLQFSQHYPLSADLSAQAQTLTIATGSHRAFDILLRGEKSGISNTWLRRTLDLSTRTSDLGIEKCGVRGLGQFGQLAQLTSSAGSVVAGLPAPFAPGLAVVADTADSRGFAYSASQLQIAQRRDLFPLLAIGTLTKIVAADLSSPRDCNDDLVLLGTTGMALWHNSGEGRFSALPIPLTGSFADGLAVDVDGDADVDLILVAADGLHLLVNDGDGAMRDATALLPSEASLSSPSSVAPIHLAPDDGRVDLIVGRATPGASPLVLQNTGTGSFVVATMQPGVPGSGSRKVATGDINGDGLTDLLVTSNVGLDVYMQGSAGTLTAQSGVLPPGFTLSSPSDLVLKDIDGDCDVDLTVVDALGVHVLLNAGGGAWNTAQTLPLSAGASNVSYVNLDADDVLDMLIGGRNDGAWWASQTR